MITVCGSRVSGAGSTEAFLPAATVGLGSCVWVSGKGSGIFSVLAAAGSGLNASSAFSTASTEISLPVFSAVFSLTAWAISSSSAFSSAASETACAAPSSVTVAGAFSKISGDISCFICSFIWTSSLLNRSSNSPKKSSGRIASSFSCTDGSFSSAFSITDSFS